MKQSTDSKTESTTTTTTNIAGYSNPVGGILKRNWPQYIDGLLDMYPEIQKTGKKNESD